MGAAVASLLIVLFSSAAVTAAVLLEIDDTKARFFAAAPPPIDLGPAVTRAEAGRPRTFLLLGSDERVGDEDIGRKPLSDTIVLVRADPGRETITVMSVPRDLRVYLPGYGLTRINAAYQRGGPRGTVEALKALFDQAGTELQIHHAVNVDFRGFRRAVDYIGGVYVDVDRDYFNDNAPPVGSFEPYATIDVDPGYQRLAGQDALDYVRYRHGDDDFVRAARQQDFLRQVRDQPSVRRLLEFQRRDRLAKVFARYVQVDKSFRSTKTLLGLLKLGAYLRDAPIRTIRFPGATTADGLYVEATPEALREALDRFLHPARPAAAQRSLERRSVGTSPGGRSASRYLRGLSGFRAQAQPAARDLARRVGFPVHFPVRQVPGSRLEGERVRAYGIRTRAGAKHRAYRFVLATGELGEYYGVQGTAWRTPPILDSPDRVQTVGSRRLLLFADGPRLRLVGFRTRKGAYWVSNTLNRALGNREMIGLALSLARLRRGG